MFAVYVLYSRKYDKIYIGFTSNLEQRLISHNKLSNKGWTPKYRPWKLILKEEFPDKKSAMKRERELKSHKGRDFIRNLILEK
ncbi:MAG TPA: GIY-YIG nuclease family protein [Candidatus Cloacimonetes bacterium]|nr:GIY-YIG nuclease family protein [Candidatus Cloacimonadota bacterium]